MKNTCSYNNTVICDYKKDENTILYNCPDCPHYNPPKSPEQEEQIPLYAGIPAIGCLFAFIVIVIGVLFGISELIKWLRS
jgi:hypothetical protein